MARSENMRLKLLFLSKILKDVDRYCMPSIRKTVKLECAALGDDSILYGALAMTK